MNLKEFSNIIKEIIGNNIDNETYNFIKKIPEGESNYDFVFIKNGSFIKISSPIRSFSTAFEIANRAFHQKDYELSLRISSEGKTKTISKKGHSSKSIKKLKDEMLFGIKADRIFYEIASTERFNVTYSEYEGTIIKFKDKIEADKFLQLLIGLFPFVEIKRDTKSIEIHCTFSIGKYNQFGKRQKKKGELKCLIKIDRGILGTKLSSFIF